MQIEIIIQQKCQQQSFGLNSQNDKFATKFESFNDHLFDQSL